MNITAVNFNNNLNNRNINFGNSQELASQLGLDVLVREAVDAYMPSIKKQVDGMVRNGMNEAKRSIAYEMDAKLDTYDKFARIESAIQQARKTNDKDKLIKDINLILVSKPVDLPAKGRVLKALRDDSVRLREFINNNL